jgi:hypothetical protein
MLDKRWDFGLSVNHLLASKGRSNHVWPAVRQMPVKVVEVLQELSNIAAQDVQQLCVSLSTKQGSSQTAVACVSACAGQFVSWWRQHPDAPKVKADCICTLVQCLHCLEASSNALAGHYCCNTY